MARRWPMVRTAHRFSLGRVNQRLRRTGQSLPGTPCPPPPIGHNCMPGGEIEPEWLKERPMSDDWNHDQQHHDQNHGDWQGDQAYHPPQPPNPEFGSEVAHPADQPSEDTRLAAIEAAIADLKANVADLKAGLPPAVIHPVGEAQASDIAAPAPDGDKLVAIEAELASLRELVTSIAGNMSTIGADVKTHADLHAETRAIVDEQHQLMRGLNYIITTAIGTLTSATRPTK